MKYFPGNIIVALLILSFILYSCNSGENKADKAVSDPPGKAQPEQQAQASDQKGAGTQPPVDEKIDVDADTILGRWLRPDGNYTLGINAITEDNKLEATYHNPSPINVAVAELKAKEPVKIYIEFDDENYRGSYYDLEYDPVNDVLQGTYFQASYGQTYHIAFIRTEDQ